MANPTQAQIEEAERSIVAKLVDAAFTKNFTISVNDGEVTVLKKSSNKDAIIGALFSTGEDYLFIHEQDGKRIGTIYFVYGNSGWDVIADNTDVDPINTLIAEVEPLINEYEEKFCNAPQN